MKLIKLVHDSIDIILYTSFSYLVIWLLCLLTIYVSGSVLSQLTLKIADKEGRISRNQSRTDLIQRVYKILLEFYSIFYYLFLPLPIVFIVLITGFLVFVMDYFNVISSGALGGVIAFAIIMSGAVLKSLFIRKEVIPDEFCLKRSNAKELYKICDDISFEMGIEPVDSIYVYHDSSIGVFQEGSILKFFSGRTRKSLIIGIGALKKLPLNQLKAVLVHEFGHLINSKQSGGPFSLFVRRNIKSALEIMEEDRVDSWYNPSWLYLSLYKKIFFEISTGSSRLQELLADEWVNEISGPEIFKSSLINFTRNQIEYSITSQIALMCALNNNQEPENIYNYKFPHKWPDKVTYGCGKIFMEINNEGLKNPFEMVEQEFLKEMERETGKYDTHPSFKDRLSNLKELTESGVSGEDENKGTEYLIPDLPEFQKYFSKMLYYNLVKERDYLSEIDYQKRVDRNS